jgi:tetratricopeptide (TPR) repeat protein
MGMISPAPSPATAHAPVRRWRLALSEERSKSLIALLMALLTCMAAAVASLSANANANKGTAQRSSDQLNEQLVGLRADVQGQLARDLDAWGLEFRQIELSLAEGDRAAAATDDAQRALAQELAQIDRDLADWLVSRGGLFAAPWYDAKTYAVDFNAYSAATAERSTQLTQQAKRDLDVASAWDAIGNTSITVLTLIAVALFFLGLSAAIGGRARPILGVAGGVTGAVALAWTISLATTSVHRVPDSAINSFVQSQVETIAAGSVMETLSDAARGHLDTAIADARQAVAADPEYEDGRLQLADACGNRALATIFAPGGNPAASQQDLLEAQSSYRAVIATDPANPAAWWNIGWVNYLLGDNEAAVGAADQALALRPDNPAILMNKVEALIALGRSRDASAALDAAITVAAARAGGATDYTLQQGDMELTRLIALRPAVEHDALVAARDKIRSAAVARRIGRNPVTVVAPSAAITAEVRPVTLDTATGQFNPGDPLADGASIIEGTAVGLAIGLTANGTVAATTEVSVRVWYESRENADYRIDRPWSDGTSLQAISPYGHANIPMSAGAYHVEVFLDAARVVSFDLTVASAG